jgi:site-specific recombinase XerD
MDITNSIISFRRWLKRRNLSPNTIRSYLNNLKLFVIWLPVQLERANRDTINAYVEHLMERHLAPKTINCHLNAISRFYNFLRYEQGLDVVNPVGSAAKIRMPKPLPRHLEQDQIDQFFKVITDKRDIAIFKLMLRCGLRVEEVANLRLDTVDLKRRKIVVRCGKGEKDRVVYISDDACQALASYLLVRPSRKTRRLFLVNKGSCKGKALSIRGIQKRIEYYSRKSNVKVSCHQLRHTMATQLLNADIDLVTIQDLLGHNCFATTERYCKVSNLKVQRDYHRAMNVVLDKSRNVHSNTRKK